MITKPHFYYPIAAIIFIAALVWLFMSNGLEVKFPKLDSIGHFLGFLFLTGLINHLIKPSLFTLSISLTLYAALTEIGQHYLGFRNGEFRDFIADALGIGVFVIIYYLVQQYKIRRQS